MRNAIVYCKLDDFRVHHNKPYFLRALLVDDCIYKRVDTYTLTTTGGTGNDHMRHLSYINKYRLTCNSPTKNHWKLHLHVSWVFPCSFNHVLKAYNTCLGIRDFYSYCLLSRNWSQYSYFLSTESVVKLVFPSLDFAYDHTLGKLQLIHSDRRAFDDIGELYYNLLLGKSLYYDHSLAIRVFIYLLRYSRILLQ